MTPEEKQAFAQLTKQNERLQKLLTEVYTWALCAGCHEDDLLRRVRAEVKPNGNDR